MREGVEVSCVRHTDYDGMQYRIRRPSNAFLDWRFFGFWKFFGFISRSLRRSLFQRRRLHCIYNCQQPVSSFNSNCRVSPLFSFSVPSKPINAVMMTSTLSKFSIVVLSGVLDFSLALSPPRSRTTNPYVIVDVIKPKQTPPPKPWSQLDNPYVIVDVIKPQHTSPNSWEQPDNPYIIVDKGEQHLPAWTLHLKRVSQTR